MLYLAKMKNVRIVHGVWPCMPVYSQSMRGSLASVWCTFFRQNFMCLSRTLDPHPPIASWSGQIWPPHLLCIICFRTVLHVCSTTNWCAFSLKSLGFLTPTHPLFRTKSKKTHFFGHLSLYTIVWTTILKANWLPIVWKKFTFTTGSTWLYEVSNFGPK